MPLDGREFRLETVRPRSVRLRSAQLADPTDIVEYLFRDESTNGQGIGSTVLGSRRRSMAT